MVPIRNATPVVILTAVLAGGFGTPVSGAEPVNDVRIVVDVSGSMKKNDPGNLRVPALRLLTGLLPAGSRAGVWTFGKFVNMLVPLGTVGDAWKRRADRSAGDVHSRGPFTNIEDALHRATRDWKRPDPRFRRSVILLTDGMVDVAPDAAKNAASRDRILSGLLPRLRAAGARINTVALSEKADHDLLRKMAVATGGASEEAFSAERLQRIFLRMFEKATNAETVPLRDNRFTVDESIDEFTVLVFRREGAKPARLEMPAGEKVGSADQTRGVSWRTGEGYDLVTVKQPAAGAWKVHADVDPDNRVLVVTDLKLRTTDLPNHAYPGQDLRVAAHLENEGSPVREADFLKLVTVRAIRRAGDEEAAAGAVADDGREPDETAKDGVYTVSLGPDLGEGTHELEIVVDGGTFVRQRRQTVEVRWPVTVDVSAAAEAHGYRIEVAAREEFVDPATLGVTAELTGPGGVTTGVPIARRDDGVWEGTANDVSAPGTHQVSLRVRAATPGGDPMELRVGPFAVEGIAPAKPEPPPAPPLPAPPAVPDPEPPTEPEAAAEEAAGSPPNWLAIASITLGINLVLSGAVLVGWRRWRRRESTDDLDVELGLEAA